MRIRGKASMFARMKFCGVPCVRGPAITLLHNRLRNGQTPPWCEALRLVVKSSQPLRLRYEEGGTHAEGVTSRHEMGCLVGRR
ncbi:hypothetical protein HBI17_090970 [Parastagonospora nodorum]|nr:hypothetical protein HBI17_090970 [Parastagonospora nodorum]